MATLYIIAGCNGSGKTTASNTLLPEFLNCKEFVNADAIAAGLSPFSPDAVSLEAGKIMLGRISQLIGTNTNFAIETTLSGKVYIHIINNCRSAGYEIVLIYFWLNSPELAIERVKLRVKRGGHDIPKHVIYRRYKRGIVNFFKTYQALSDYWLVFDNSHSKPELVAEGNNLIDFSVSNNEIWASLTSVFDEYDKN
jgi:predicted ABC-type ATPase